ncbi:MAG: HAMP domain-containing sensor histidine kinase [Aliarcobacter sp.]|nr:HAMP domain-containing sensor histidine kinase [Aliarcobacter sp.]
MLIEQLSIAYRCHCSIGNSVNLKEMIHEVLKTFVSESYAFYGHFCLLTEDMTFENFDSFGKIIDFDYKKYDDYKDQLSIINDEDLIILKINLDNGILFLASKNVDVDCSFFLPMFESLISKLNLSVNACINYNKLEKVNHLLKKQKKELIKANKIKDDFLANMSHELKTPLNSISIISKVMANNKDNKLDDLSLKNIKIINKCSEDLTELINDILDISKIEAGELTITKNSVSLKNLIQELCDSFAPIAHNKNIEFINNFQIDNDNIFTDEYRTKQIIKNLLSNAIKFTNKGKVEISSKEFDEYFEISIIDTGIGISKNNLNYIFDRFKQIDDSMGKKHQGTGLGLAICKQLSKMLNGYITVTSEEEIGSTFKYIIYKKSNENILEDYNKTENDIKESVFLFDEIFLEKQIYLFHSNSIEQFNLTINLKKYGLKVIPILNEDKLKEKIDDIKNNNNLLILDSKIKNLQNIIDNEKIIKSNLLILEEGTTIENLIENLKNIQFFKGELINGKI